MILFETSTSVFELLWDIALALFILRISFVYFILSFTSGCLIAYFRFSTLQPINHLTQPQSELYTLPLWLLMFTLWARWVVVAYEVPRVRGFRVAIGLVALGFMLIAELAGGVFLYERGLTEWIWETDPTAATAGGITLLLFGLMPALLMCVEKETDEMGEVRTSHGHEGKSVKDAVPVVALSEKEKKTNWESRR
ncbi:uncharacterized protein PAC_03970 [Phialocephala subalpina]|uniref:Uncharacterized protein n=1 Tax=Phialocephala subalpina TaxID=576137 RepID=A0A1L7WMS6_9HELO|nr:uncharacterized protein PAC_03970 [Phialocephala subalpina]